MFKIIHLSSSSMPIPSFLEEPATDPLPLYRLRDGIVAVDLLAAALAHLDFFTWLAGHPATLSTICAHFEIHARPADVMMTLFNAMGLTTMAGGVFHCTLRAREHLCSTSPWNLAPYYASMKDRQPTTDMLKVLRTGKPANWGSYDPDAWSKAMERPDFAQSFTEAMDCRGMLLGPILAKKIHLADQHSLLDIAGGSGIYACAIATAHPHLRVAVLEKAPVDQIARVSIENRGCTHRVQVQAGDIFQGAWPSGFDTHLLSNVIHDWNEDAVITLLAKSHAALEPHGLLVLHDAFINAEKTGPLHIAEYSALLMNITEGKCYSMGEVRGFLNDQGFEWMEYQPTAVNRGFIVARKLQ